MNLNISSISLTVSAFVLVVIISVLVIVLVGDTFMVNIFVVYRLEFPLHRIMINLLYLQDCPYIMY